MATPAFVQLVGLPDQLTEEQVRALLSTFGELASFQLTAGRAVFKLADAALTDAVVLALNGLLVAGKTLSATRMDDAVAAALTKASEPAPAAPKAAAALPDGAIVLEIMNLASEADLEQPAEMDAIEADVAQECKELGDVTVVQMPRAGAHGAGNAYVVFKERVDAERTRRALHGRKFAGREVSCAFSGEEGAEAEKPAEVEAEAAAAAATPSLETSRWADGGDEAAAAAGGADGAADGGASSCKRAADDAGGGDVPATKVARVGAE